MDTKRSCLSLILERDASPASFLVLCVADIEYIPLPNPNGVFLFVVLLCLF